MKIWIYHIVLIYLLLSVLLLFLLNAAARRQHLVEKVIKHLEEGKLELCDRFIFSSLAYQGYARELGIEEIYKINKFAIGDYMPDLNLLFDLSKIIFLISSDIFIPPGSLVLIQDTPIDSKYSYIISKIVVFPDPSPPSKTINFPLFINITSYLICIFLKACYAKNVTKK